MNWIKTENGRVFIPEDWTDFQERKYHDHINKQHNCPFCHKAVDEHHVCEERIKRYIRDKKY